MSSSCLCVFLISPLFWLLELSYFIWVLHNGIFFILTSSFTRGRVQRSFASTYVLHCALPPLLFLLAFGLSVQSFPLQIKASSLYTRRCVCVCVCMWFPLSYTKVMHTVLHLPSSHESFRLTFGKYDSPPVGRKDWKQTFLLEVGRPLPLSKQGCQWWLRWGSGSENWRVWDEFCSLKGQDLEIALMWGVPTALCRKSKPFPWSHLYSQWDEISCGIED